MEGFIHFLVAKIILLALASSFVSCYGQSPLQDYCVAVNNPNGVFINGRFCKDPRLMTSVDFYATGYNIPGNTSNRLGSKISAATVDTFPAVNTLGISLARTDFAPGGQVPPHIHPRGSELLVVLQGIIYTGFVSSDQYNNTLFAKILYPGDVFVFPKGLIHFHVNIASINAVTFSVSGSENPDFINVANSVFGSSPPIVPEVLSRAVALDVITVRRLQDSFPDEDIVVTP